MNYIGYAYYYNNSGVSDKTYQEFISADYEDDAIEIMRKIHANAKDIAVRAFWTIDDVKDEYDPDESERPNVI